MRSCSTWQAQGALLQQGYGMTETSPLVLVLDKEDAVRKAGSAGKPALNMEMRVVGGGRRRMRRRGRSASCG